MKTSTPNPSLRRITIILIQEELKSRKLFEELHWLNYHNWFYKAELTELIMQALDLDHQSTLQRGVCNTLLDRHSQRVGGNRKELLDEATRVYDALQKHARQVGYMNGDITMPPPDPNSKPINTDPSQN